MVYALYVSFSLFQGREYFECEITPLYHCSVVYEGLSHLETLLLICPITLLLTYLSPDKISSISSWQTYTPQTRRWSYNSSGREIFRNPFLTRSVFFSFTFPGPRRYPNVTTPCLSFGHIGPFLGTGEPETPPSVPDLVTSNQSKVHVNLRSIPKIRPLTTTVNIKNIETIQSPKKRNFFFDYKCKIILLRSRRTFYLPPTLSHLRLSSPPGSSDQLSAIIEPSGPTYITSTFLHPTKSSIKSLWPPSWQLSVLYLPLYFPFCVPTERSTTIESDINVVTPTTLHQPWTLSTILLSFIATWNFLWNQRKQQFKIDSHVKIT